MSKQYTMKLTVVGDEGVGKTSLIKRYIEDRFNSEYISTIGVDFLVKNVKLEEGVEAKMVIWDIGGQDTWKNKMNLYMKGANGAIIICDLTRPVSAEHITDWLEEILTYAGDVPYVVIGNKMDLKNQKVTLEDLKMHAQDMPCFFSSAKTGKNVEKTFKTIANLMIKNLETK
ncbi:MAG: Rab family GTPase [Candidatus Helarchaeota archaeon]